jgi:hypothetical protein
MIGYGDAINALYPGASFVLVGNDYNTLQWLEPSISKPTQAILDAEIVRLNEQAPLLECKRQASQLLYETDWTTIPDVADSSQSPYLTNQAEFIAWRSQIRALAVNPIANPVFPPKPDAVWG